ncbi:MAG: hypothetical protein D6773_14445, partial [Alphaproteobacteria bacterium]
AEYPIMIVLSLLARPGFASLDRKAALRDIMLCLGLLALLTAPKLLAGIDLSDHWPKLYLTIFLGLAAAIILARTAPLRLCTLVTVAFLAGHVLTPDAVKGETHRGFFGVHTLIDVRDGAYRLLMHGTTLHGAEKLRRTEGEKQELISYYHDKGPFADVIRAARSDQLLKQVGVVGLGAGTLACYRQKGERWHFYEIDPIVVRIASDPRNFSFLSECAPDAAITLGDARQTLARAANGAYQLIIIDAFTSDAIPVHLLTREAVQVYLSKLAPGGVIALHISNNNMDLRPVVAALVRDLGLAGLVCHCGDAGKLIESYKSKATLVALAREPATLSRLAALPGWKPLEDKGWRVWTDDYSNIVRAISERMW